MRGTAVRLDLEAHEAAMSDGQLHLGRLGDDRRVRVDRRRDGLRPDARELLVGDRGEDHVAGESQVARPGRRDHARGEAPLHVVGASPVQAPAVESRRERRLHPGDSDGVRVGVEHERPAATRPTRDRDDVRPARDGLHQRRRETCAIAPLGDEARDGRLPRAAGYDAGIDRLDRDQACRELSDVAHLAVELPLLALRSYSTYSSAITRASSRIAIPSSTSSRVIVRGGTTMITFQWVMR